MRVPISAILLALLVSAQTISEVTSAARSLTLTVAPFITSEDSLVPTSLPTAAIVSAEDDYDAVTSAAGSVATLLISEAGSVATGLAMTVTSGAGSVYGILTSGAVNVYDFVTSGMLGTQQGVSIRTDGQVVGGNVVSTVSAQSSSVASPVSSSATSTTTTTTTPSTTSAGYRGGYGNTGAAGVSKTTTTTMSGSVNMAAPTVVAMNAGAVLGAGLLGLAVL